MKSQFIILFFLVVVTQTLKAADCTHRTAYIEPECNRSCVMPETCEPADANNEEFCCIDMAKPNRNAVPNLLIVSIGALVALGGAFYVWRKKKVSVDFSHRQK
jgi:hypothetical protein